MIEKKVKAATAWSYLLGLAALAIINGVIDTNLITVMPDALEVFIAPLVPALGAGVAGYLATHTMRPDLGERRDADIV